MQLAVQENYIQIAFKYILLKHIISIINTFFFLKYAEVYFFIRDWTKAGQKSKLLDLAFYRFKCHNIHDVQLTSFGQLLYHFNSMDDHLCITYNSIN